MGNTKKWKMRDGTKIRIKDMGDSHLLNTIKMLERYGRAKHIQETNELWSMPYPQGEQAQMCFDQIEMEIYDKDWSDYVPDIYWDMVEEVEKRSIK
jgi:hypothetical protein